MVKQIAIIGVGLIGGSLARALRAAGYVDEILGAGRSTKNLELAVELGVIDGFGSVSDVVGSADLVVIGASLGATHAVLEELAPHLNSHAVVTDVGSTKATVVDAARQKLGANFPRFVPGHPIAGTEQSGVGASFAELFVDHKVILTPLDETEPTAVDMVKQMWTAAGASVISMPVDVHDRALAATSHLPHLLAFNLVDTLVRGEDGEDIFALAAGGFRDFSRIASSNPGMWADIAIANRDALLAISREFESRFNELLVALENGDRAQLERIFEHAKAVRDRCVVPESKA